MRAARILAVLIALNVLLGVLAAGIVLSREYATLDAAVRKGATLPPPRPEVVRAITARPEWKREIVTPCHGLCRARMAVILRFRSDDELLRAYLATR